MAESGRNVESEAGGRFEKMSFSLLFRRSDSRRFPSAHAWLGDVDAVSLFGLARELARDAGVARAPGSRQVRVRGPFLSAHLFGTSQVACRVARGGGGIGWRASNRSDSHFTSN